MGARNDEQLCILLKGFEENADSFITPDGTRWARLVGDHWTDSRDCGCVKPKVELIMRGEIIGRAEGQAISGEFSASIMLEPDTLSVYQGSGMVTLSNFKMPIPPNCTFSSNVPPSRIAVKELRFDADGGNDISLLIYPDNTSGSHTFTCPGLPRPITMPVVTPMQAVAVRAWPRPARHRLLSRGLPGDTTGERRPHHGRPQGGDPHHCGTG